MIKCAIYPRKSKQVNDSDSMETQISMCKQYLDTKYGKDNYYVTVYDKDYGNIDDTYFGLGCIGSGSYYSYKYPEQES